MRIGIDISQIIHGTGVSVYTEMLVENLLKLDKKDEFILFGGSFRNLDSLKDFTKELKGNFSTKFLRFPPTLADILWNKLHLAPIEWFIGELDVFHSSDWAEPPGRSFKVTTVHDISPLKFPKLTNPKTVSVHKTKLARVKDEVDRVITPSQATADDLSALGISANRIRVIPEGPEFGASRKPQVEKVKRKYKIAGKYVLAIGVHPRKNTERIIEAFELVRAGEGLRLVVVGEPFMEIEERRGVHLLGHVTKDELSALLTGAEVLMFPSLYEGFGQPILEGMAAGTPVVTSNISSMPEVAGDAAVLVDPYDTDSIVEGTREALRRKKTLVKRGKVRVKQFSWEKTARRTLEVYKEAV